VRTRLKRVISDSALERRGISHLIPQMLGRHWVGRILVLAGCIVVAWGFWRSCSMYHEIVILNDAPEPLGGVTVRIGELMDLLELPGVEPGGSVRTAFRAYAEGPYEVRFTIGGKSHIFTCGYVSDRTSGDRVASKSRVHLTASVSRSGEVDLACIGCLAQRGVACIPGAR